MAANGVERLRVLVVEGDAGGRQKLRAMLESLDTAEAIEEAASAPQAIPRIDAFRPDVVLLDIELPAAASVARLRHGDWPCLVVMAGRPERAQPAFDLEAVDCLVKPVQRERLAEALRRVRCRVATRRIAELALELAGASSAVNGGQPSPSGGAAHRYPDQMTIRVRRRMFALPVADISWIEGASQYSRIHARSGEFLLSRSLASLECELDPARFFRIHRSAIVNAAFVREVMSRGDGRYNVYLHGGVALPLGRGRRDTLRRLLGGMGRGERGGDSPLQRTVIGA